MGGKRLTKTDRAKRQMERVKVKLEKLAAELAKLKDLIG